MNDHLKKQLDSNNCTFLPKDVKDGVLADFEIMSHLGIDNDENQNKFFMIRNHVPEILNLIFKIKLNDKVERLLAAEVFRNKEKAPIGTLLELIEAVDLALKKMVPQSIRPKLAYPQSKSRQQLPQYDVSRWVEATKKIYGLMSKGQSSTQARESVIGNWERREQMDYEQWLKFYKERVPEKYPKLAFDTSEPLLGGLPVNTLRAIMPTPNGQGHATKVSPGLPQHLPNDVNEVRETIESQRKKLIGRLNSAEKLLSTMDGQLFAGDDQELMLKLLQDLKRRIQITNKRTVKSSLFEDHVYRTANRLKVQGKDKAAGFFLKIAQLGDLGAPIDIPGVSSPEAGPPAADSGKGDKQETHDLLKEFFDNIKRGVNDPDDTVEEREEIEKEEAATAPAAPASPPIVPPPAPPVNASYNPDRIKIGAGYWLVKNAQEAPPAPIPNRMAPLPQAQRVITPAAGPDDEPISDDNADDLIEVALKNVNINDVVNRLEMLVSIYNKRELSRQLGILDIMMDRLGIAAYFPSLGEAMSKALEANQYIGNRLGEILSRIKGSVDSPGASEWIEVSEPNSPETAGLRARLEQEKQKDEQRKELRKQQDLAKMQGTAAPQASAPTSVGEAADLQQPSRIEKAPKLEVR
jgi:hypothetical protein